MGYLDWFSEPFKLSGGSHDLGTIGLRKDSKMLEGATVVYKKPLFEQKMGKTIMNVESHPGTAGDNVLELLRKMPGVMVDNSDNISLQGKSGVLILIDDRDPHLSGDDLANFLKSMPATTIDRVEVMKNPSARYDAAGTSGIINQRGDVLARTPWWKETTLRATIQGNDAMTPFVRHGDRIGRIAGYAFLILGLMLLVFAVSDRRSGRGRSAAGNA